MSNKMAGNPHYDTATYYAAGNEADQRRALVEATLALAWEQRTANLITWHQFIPVSPIPVMDRMGLEQDDYAE
jgi:hypothetical protein